MGTTDALVQFQPSNQVTVGTISGTTVLDGLNVADFGNYVLEYVKDKPGRHLLLNFEYITYMSSAGLTELLRINEALRASSGSIRLCNLSCEIRRVFKITNLDQMFAIHETDWAEPTEALEEMRKHIPKWQRDGRLFDGMKVFFNGTFKRIF